MYKDYKKRNLGDCVVVPTTHSLEIDLIYSFKNSNSSNAIFLCCEKGYIYQCELNKVLMIDSRSVIRSLIRDNIIEEFILPENELKNLSLIRNVNIGSLSLLTAFRLTVEAKILLQNPYIYKLLCSVCNPKIKHYIESLKEKYNNKIKEMELEEQRQKDKLLLRYRIAKEKRVSLRTPDDLVIIQMIENDI